MIGAFAWLLLLLGLAHGLHFGPRTSITRGRLKTMQLYGVDAVDKPEPFDPNMLTVELNDELKSAFMSYAMSTILGRALPDIRDGMKPVHRRVLYAMQALNLSPDSGYRKCARVVGEVLGKFHPHGDNSVYDALVRMAQDFVTLHPLVNGHGNFGSVDDDPPAAMRYTEAKLSNLAYDALLSEIKEDTVDFVPNFDGNEMEPAVLPAKLPMLLVNGASGIAVGMATNIPPHNLGELCDGLVALIANPSLSDEELFKLIPAPDFPTGGKIMGLGEAVKLYTTSRGSIVMRAKTSIDTISQSNKGITRTKNAIIITELPYLTNKAALLEKIADLVNDKKLDGISDLRDESDRDGIRMVVELKKDAVPSVVLNNLYKKTPLQSVFSGNMLALVDEGKQPQRIGLKQALKYFIQFRFNTIRRRTAFQLAKVTTRDHIVQGLLIALDRIDEIVALIRSNDSADGKSILMSDSFKLSNEQAEAILSLRLRQLSTMEGTKLRTEHQDLEREIIRLGNIMQTDGTVYGIMRDETVELKRKHGVPRKSIIWGEEAPLSDMDLTANERSVIIITTSGYIKRIPLDEYKSQVRGGKGKISAKLNNEEDTVMQFFSCNDHDSILFITERGVAYSINAFQIPKCSRYAKGVPVPQILPISSEDRVTSVIPVDDFAGELVLLTSNGYIKRTPLKAFATVSARGLIIISLEDKDSLRWARVCKPTDQLIISTRDGFASRYYAGDLKVTGRLARGASALRLRDGDHMADMDIISLDRHNSSSFLFAVTAKGYGKRIEIDDFRTQKRNGKGMTAIKFKPRAGGGGSDGRAAGKSSDDYDNLSCLRVCNTGDDIVISTEKGTVIRQRLDELSVQSRRGTGVLIQKIDESDRIMLVDIIPASAVKSAIEGVVEGGADFKTADMEVAEV